MKTFFDSIKLSFLLLGAILGAGFISGSELINFFGENGSMPFFLLSILLFFFLLLFLFFLYKDKFYNENQNLIESKAFNIGVFISSFIVTICSLSGISELLNTELYNFVFPFYSIIFLLLAFIIIIKDIKGVEYVNLFIVPILIILTLYLIFDNGKLEYRRGNEPFFVSIIKSVLYVFLNIFSNVKVINCSVKNKSKKSCLISAITVSLIIFILGLIILLSINGNYEHINKDIPLLFLSNGITKKIAFDIALFFAMFSSLIADLCTLKELLIKENTENKEIKLIMLFFAVLFFSLIKISNIVKYFYPIVGGIGLVYFIKCIKLFGKRIILKKEKMYGKQKAQG